MQAVVLGILLGFLLVGLYLAAWPVEARPAAWDPPEAPAMEGPLVPNRALTGARVLLDGMGTGPEAVAFDDEGFLYTGFEDGRIVRVDPPDGQPDVHADTGGRPLGMAFDGAGNLLVADAERGLVSVDPEGSVQVLVRAADGVAFGFTNDVDVTRDGRVYFTDSSDRFGYDRVMTDILEHGGRGRFMRWDPDTDDVEVLMEELQFANGVALAEDDDFVLVCETGSYRVHRYWLSGPRAGSSEVFLENLPGFPDNVTRGEDGLFWVALASPRNALLDRLAPRPALRRLLLRLPAWMRPGPERYGHVLGVDDGGAVVHSLQDPTGDVAYVASAREHGGHLYLGTYRDPALRVVPVPGEEN